MDSIKSTQINSNNLLKSKIKIQEDNTDMSNSTENNKNKPLVISRTLNNKIKFIRLISQKNLLEPDSHANDRLIIKRYGFATKKDISKSHEVSSNDCCVVSNACCFVVDLYIKEYI